MKYICLKNISLFKNELLKYYFLQILFLVIVLLANLNLDETEIIDFVKSILSIKSMSFDNILVTLYVVFSFFLAMLISAKIYIKDTLMLKNISNRIKEKEYIKLNLIFVLLLELILNILPIILMMIFLLINKIEIEILELIEMFIYFYLQYALISLNTMMFLTLNSKIRIKRFCLVIPLFAIILQLIFDITSMNIILLGLLCLLIVFVNMSIFNYKEVYEKYG